MEQDIKRFFSMRSKDQPLQMMVKRRPTR